MPLTWPVIRTPKEVYGVKNEAEYARVHRKHLDKLKKRGLPVIEHVVTEDVPVIVSGGIWIVICTCSGGAATGQTWPEARCFDCGAVYTSLRWPDDPKAIADALMARPAEYRHWWGDADSQARLARILGDAWASYGNAAGESVADLETDNVSRGLSARVETVH